MVEKGLVLLPHSCRVLGLILSLAYSLCVVLHVISASHLSFEVLRFPSISQKYEDRWNECVYGVLHPIQGVFQAHAQCSQDRIQIHCDPQHEDKPVPADE